MRFGFPVVTGMATLMTAALAGPTWLAAQTTTQPDSVLARMDTTTHRIDVTLPAGRIVRRITSRADTNQRYALYLPSSFTANGSGHSVPARPSRSRTHSPAALPAGRRTARLHRDQLVQHAERRARGA